MLGKASVMENHPHVGCRLLATMCIMSNNKILVVDEWLGLSCHGACRWA